MPTTQPCNVALIVTTLGQGGTERYVVDLAIGLASCGISTVVLVDSLPLDRAQELRRAGVPVALLNSDRLTMGEYSERLCEEFTKYNVQLIHFSGWLHYQQVVQAARLLRLPVIATRHCTDRKPTLRELCGLNRRPFGLYRDRYRACKQRIPAICISEISRRNLRARWGTDIPLAMIHNGVPRIDTRAQQNANDELTIAWVGSMCVRKYPELALEVFELVRVLNPRARMLMLGDGPLRANIANKAQRLSKRIEVCGFSPLVPQQLARCSVYLQTSMNEGIAYSVLEAMAIGLPVVATDVGATREAVLHGSTGFLTNAGAAKQLGKYVADLLNDPMLGRTMGAAGARHVQANFSLSRMVEKTIATYRTMCGVDVSERRRM